MIHFFKVQFKRFVIGFFSSLTVILVISFPFTVIPGQIYDLRIIPLLLSILYGGYGVGIIVTFVSTLYRYILGFNSGFIQMLITFPPILAIAFYLVKRFNNYSRRKKIIVAVSLDLAFVLPNIVLFISQHSISQKRLVFFLYYALIQGIGTVIIVYLIETIRENVVLRLHMQQLEKTQALSELAASFAHEIRNPITVCKGFLQLLNETNIDIKQMGYIRMVLSELDRANSIINEYLSFAKPQFEKIDNVDLAQLIRQVTEIISPYAMLRNVTIDERVEQSLQILVDKGKLTQVILNIMKNGIEAMPDGGALRVVVRKHGEHAVVDIIDDGVGTTEEEIKRLGNPFYSTKQTGTGLGLMSSYRFIDLMNGHIKVQSVKGKGTRFSVYLSKSTA